jgi:hypothetical protein
MAAADAHLRGLIVYVDDPVAAATLYERIFGIRREMTADDGAYVELDTGSTKLAFATYVVEDRTVPGGRRRAPGRGAPPNVQLALILPNVDRAYVAALGAGCTSIAEPENSPPDDRRVALVRDPFGTLVELTTAL